MRLEAALSRANLAKGGCNHEFYRPDAALALVGITDEPEQSVNPWSYYVSYLQALKDDPSMVSVNAIAGDFPGGCGGASPGTGLYEGVVATGGLFLSICSTDFGSGLTALAQMGVGLTERQTLSQAPVVDTLEVRVTEREPAAILLADQFYLVDEDGIPFKRVERGERGKLPIITGVARSELTDLSRPAESVSRALDLLRIYQAKKRPRLGELHIGEDGGISLYTAVNGTRLRLGRAEPERALQRYDALRAALGTRAEGLELVHLDGEAAPDHPERVVARFVSQHDEAAVLAEGLDASEPEPAADEESDEPSIARPKRRIPRYH